MDQPQHALGHFQGDLGLIAVGGFTVGEQDDMGVLLARHQLLGQMQAAHHVGAAISRETVDLAVERRLVAGEALNRVGLGSIRHDRDLIPGIDLQQSLDEFLGRVLGGGDPSALHAAGNVDHQHHAAVRRGSGRDRLALGGELDRVDVVRRIRFRSDQPLREGHFTGHHRGSESGQRQQNGYHQYSQQQRHLLLQFHGITPSVLVFPSWERSPGQVPHPEGSAEENRNLWEI